jgi:hypothetical protein
MTKVAVEMSDSVRDVGTPVEVWRAGASALVAALRQRGLVAEGHPTEWAVRARHPAAEAGGGDPRGRALSPGLRQEVRCRRGADGGWWWYWVWSGATRHSEPELEPLCPLSAVETAADRIARVLAVGS